MGSRGMKRNRKGGPREHLPKVGTRDEVREEQHLEREAIGDVMGLGGVPSWIRWGALLVGAAILVVAVVALVALD
ncbi:MAG TPA: hypothetical protein VF152_12845 [Acidimicrobiia bacterium]